jgi:cobalt-zinc-cadmium efflux system protein
MSLNERGAFYHLLGDAGGSVAVIVSTIAVAVFDLPVADPAAAVLIGALVLWSAGKVLWESTSILLQRSPTSPAQLRERLAAVEGVDAVEDLHVWQVCSQLTVGTVRVVSESAEVDSRRALQQRIHDVFSEHGVDHATVEVLDSRDQPTTQDHAH